MGIKYRVHTLFMGVAALIGLFVVGTLAYLQHQQTLAQYHQDDNSGQWQLTFQNRAGIFSQKNVTVDGKKAHLTLAPGTQGDLTTSTIAPSSSYGWRRIAVTGTWSHHDHVKVQLLSCSATPTPLPQEDTAHIRGGDNAGGFTLESGQLDISSLDNTKHACLQVKLLLSSDTSHPAPIIKKMSVSWKPKTVFLINASAPNKITTSDNLTYKVDYSVSYVDDTNVVVYLPIPQAVGGSFTPGYNQDLAATFKSATQGGQYTSKELVVNGVTVPANSVYWNLGTQTAGVTGSLHAVFGTYDGLQNGVTYATAAVIASPHTAAVTSDSDPTLDDHQPVTTVVESKPLPSLNKSATGITLNGATHVHAAAPYNNRTTYSLQARNDGTKKETIFNAVATDDLTDIFAKLQSPTCGAVADPASRISAISDGGVLDAPAKTITWQLGHMAPGTAKHRSFTVDYSGCAKDTEITNTASLTADNITRLTSAKSIIMGIDATPNGMFAKGERTKVQGGGYIAAGTDDSSPGNDDPTDPRGKTHMGGMTTYLLMAANRGAVRLDDTVMMDMIPAGQEFVAATLPSNVKGKIFYYTRNDHTNAAEPPAFDHTNVANPGDGWSDTVPAQANNVKWVAFYVPCLAPTGIAAGGSCADKPNAAIGEITVKVATPQDVCKAYTITNKGLFRTFSSAPDLNDQSDTGVQPLATPLTLNDDEVSHIIPNVASFKGAASVTGPSHLRPAESGNYTITYTNNGAATAKDAAITIDIPTVSIAGKDTLLDFVNLTGASYEKTVDPVSGKIATLTIKAGDIPVGVSRQFTLTLSLPKGPNQNATFKVAAVLRSSDPNNCAPINQAASTTTTAVGSPKLQVIKQRDEALIKAKGDIHYQMTFRSIGDMPTTDTFVVDRVPAKTIFKHAYTGGKDANNTTFNCRGCKVYFAGANAPLPANISPTTPLTPNDIYKYFSPGVETTPGVWAAPTALPAKDVRYVAYLTDDTTLAAPQTNSGITGTVGMVVTNDDDGDGPGTDGSVDGTIVTNYAAIISNDTLQAIGNSVHTTILGDPGLAIEKTAGQSTVTAGATVDWYIDYRNDSQTKDTEVTIEDTLPYGVTLAGLSHQWNAHAQAQGLSAGEQNIMNSPHVSVVTNPDGTTKVTVSIAQGLRGGDLSFQEGGKLHIVATVKPSTASGVVLTNEARGCYQNELVGPYCVNDGSSVAVNNADLWLRKQVNNTQPVAGDTLIYSLVIANKGKHAADDVVIRDTLPAGLCFENVNVVTPAGWSVGSPHIEGGAIDCQEKPTTLVWSRDHNNALTQQGSEAGHIPGNSADITLQYAVRVHSTTTPGSTLTNNAQITTKTPEDTEYPNGDTKTVTTPLPDPYVRKTASRATVLPGDAVDYHVSYGNASREASLGSLVIDGLPDYDGDGRTDVTVLSVVPQHGETVYYYDENNAPKLNTLGLSATYNFTANTDFKRSSSDFAAGSYPTHIIIVPAHNGALTGLAGSHAVMVKVQFTNPYTGADTPAGMTITNHAEITSTTTDSDTTNNQADSSVKTPTADLEISKTAAPSGAFPGVAPGEQITYTVRFANRGAAPVCSVFITEHYPNSITNITQSFTRLTLTNAAGMPINPVDPTGAQIGAPVDVSYDAGASRWQLGGHNYANVCLPSGAEGSFTITATVKDDTPDKHAVENTVRIGEDSPATEDSMDNNRATVSTTVYRADVRIKKDGLSAGKDGVFGTPDDSTTEVKPKERVRYSLAYNNSGNRDAKDTIIDEVVPADTCFAVGSVKNYPAGTKLSYSNDGGSTYTYQPQGNDGDKDCHVTHLRVDFGTLSAPANLAAGAQTTKGRMKEVMGNVAKVSAGGGHILALKSDGTLWAWGSNSSGQLGTGDTRNRHVPEKILDDIIAISAGGSHSLALTKRGTLWAWGDNSYGQLGTGDTVQRIRPTEVSSYITDISAGYMHSLAITSSNTLLAWGGNYSGQLGTGDTENRNSPVPVVGLSSGGVRAISAGSEHSMAVTNYGMLFVWGSNQANQIGNGTWLDVHAPSPIIGDIATVAAGTSHSMAITTSGKVLAWGGGRTYQDGSGGYSGLPTEVMNNGKAISQRFVITADHRLLGWGDNPTGQLGTGDTISQHDPVKILDDIKEIADTTTSVAVTNDGKLLAWGDNSYGQLGTDDGRPSYRPIHIRGTGVTVYELASGETTIPLSSPTAPLAWKGLYINTESIDQPANASVRYDLMQQDCQTPIAGFANLDPNKSPIDISSLPANTTRFCLKVTYEQINQMTVTARMSYEGKEDPSISFEVIANDTVNAATINNTTAIATTTPETNYHNNASSYKLRVPQADLSLTKRVDQSVISPQDITAGKQLTYTLTLENKGPNDADGVTVTDTLPDGMTYVAAQQASGAGNFTVANTGQKVTFRAADALPVGGRASFTITATVNSAPLPPANTPFYNDACAASGMADPVTDNNCDSATVTVGSFANVYTQKAAPDKANIGKEITYTLRYGNNGNVTAENWTISDPLDSRLTFVSAAQTAGDVAVTCTHNAQTVTCMPQGNAPLPVGASGEVQIVARVARDQALVDANAVITNRACVATTTPQITVSDDCGSVTTTVWPGDLAGFGGRVFLDFDKDITYNAAADKPLVDVEVITTGFDTTKHVYGPDHQHPRYREVITALLPTLTAEGIVPAGTTVDAVHGLPNYVVVAPVKTSRDGMYSFNGLKPGTYFAHQSQPALYGSTGSTGGYLGIDGATGQPITSPQDGHGSKQDNAIDANIVSRIILGEGDFSQGNDFGELPGSIGSHIWRDADNNGVRNADEAGLSGVEVTLYRDSDGNGAYTDGVDTVVAVTKTAADGSYLFTGLSLNSGDGTAKYIVRVTDADKITTGHTNTTGRAGEDNHSQAAGGYAVTLRPDKGADVTADFGYFRPLDLAITKEIDGNGDGTFAAQEQIRPDAAFRYRVVIDNRSLDSATDVQAEDIVPKGMTILKATADIGTATVAGGKVAWTVPSLAPTNRATLTIEAVVNSDALAAYRAGLETSGVSRNTARITHLRQHDATPNNNRSHADAFMKAGLGDRVWIDRNTNGVQDDGEPGLNGVTVTLRNAAGNIVRTATTATVGGQEGIYHFADMEPGDYTVHMTVPQGYALTAKDVGSDTADSDIDQTTGVTPTITIVQGDNNLTIDAGLVPLLSLGDTVWDDRNNDGRRDSGEPGLNGVTVMLFSDDGDGTLDITKDTQIASVKTDAHGHYRFNGLVAGNYFVVIDSTDAALSSYNLSQTSTTNPNDTVNHVNDGTAVDDLITTARALTLTYGAQPQEHGAYNDTIDFGFHKPAPAPQPPATPAPPLQPQQPPRTTDLANTGESIWLIILAGLGSIAIAIAIILLIIKRQKGKN